MRKGVYMKFKTVCWLSAGVSSFLAGWFLKDKIDDFIYIDISDQHPDSLRFIKECEKVLCKPIQILSSDSYTCVSDCIEATGCFKMYANGFAPCTNYLKKRVRQEWEYEHRDYCLTYIWGFDVNEVRRADNICSAMPQFEHIFPLIDKHLSKSDVHGYFYNHFDFKRPLMYDLGYPNNNCIGCIKGGMGYWNKIRVDFPDVFASRSQLEREIGFAILKDKNGPIYLDSLEPNRGDLNTEVFPECGVFCYLADTWG